MKLLLISRDGPETRVALLDAGRIYEFYTERPGRLSRVGNIYKGRVENVLAGMDAAFVDIGLERNGYLSVDEVAGGNLGGGRPQKKITQLLRSGEQVLVQVIREGMGGKGPRLTTQLSLAGRYVVYMPGGSNSGASRRLEEAERERLRGLCRVLLPEDGGLIARTAAEGASEAALARDLRFLQRVWAGVARRAAAAQAPCLVYPEAELALRAVRDLSGPDVEKVIVDDEHLHRRVVNYLRAVAPRLVSRVELYGEADPLFERYGLEGEARKALARRVELPSGGYLVIDPTEAMTVIDVNTGRYVGKRLLEDTTLKTNLEACRELVRQLRLRDIGGIIVIDFIDMALEGNREAVLAALQIELAADRTKTYVVALSPLGLVEMTRQNVTLGLREIMTSVCPTCHGEGRVLSEESALLDVERRLLKAARRAVTPGVRVGVHPRMLTLLRAGSPSPLHRVETSSGRFVILSAAEASVPLDHVATVPD
jgi:ribonuclease G